MARVRAATAKEDGDMMITRPGKSLLGSEGFTVDLRSRWPHSICRRTGGQISRSESTLVEFKSRAIIWENISGCPVTNRQVRMLTATDTMTSQTRFMAVFLTVIIEKIDQTAPFACSLVMICHPQTKVLSKET